MLVVDENEVTGDDGRTLIVWTEVFDGGSGVGCDVYGVHGG